MVVFFVRQRRSRGFFFSTKDLIVIARTRAEWAARAFSKAVSVSKPISRARRSRALRSVGIVCVC